MARCKDPKTNKTVTKTMTWKKPEDMTDSEARHYIQKVAYDFEENLMNESNGKGVKDTDISLIDYAFERIERMKDSISPHSYLTEQRKFREMEKYFGQIK